MTPTVADENQQVCVQQPTPADNVTLLTVAAERRPCSDRPTSPAQQQTRRSSVWRPN